MSRPFVNLMVIKLRMTSSESSRDVMLYECFLKLSLKAEDMIPILYQLWVLHHMLYILRD